MYIIYACFVSLCLSVCHCAHVLVCVLGLVEVPTDPIYAATKHGVVGFSRSMVSQATSDSVRVNCICPSFVKTRMMDNIDQTQANLQQLVKIYGVAE